MCWYTGPDSLHVKSSRTHARTVEFGSESRSWVFLHDHLVGGHVRRLGPTGRVRRVRVLYLRVAVWRVVLMVFEAVEVLVAFPARVATVRLVLLHAQGTGIGVQSFGIDDGEGAVFVVFEGLGVVAVLVAISKSQCGEREPKKLTLLWYFKPFWFLYAFSHPITGQ